MRPRTVVGAVSALISLAFLARMVAGFTAMNDQQRASEEAFRRRIEEQKARQAVAAAATAGGLTPKGCMDWAIQKCGATGDDDCDVCMDLLRGCLDKSKPDDAFCATVPPYSASVDSPASDAWEQATRAHYRLTRPSCSAMWKFVQLRCHPL